MVEGDVAAMRQRSNRTALRKALLTCGLCCDDWDAVSITDCQLTRKGIDQIVGMAVAQQLAAEGSLPLAPGSQIDATFAGLAAGGPDKPLATDAPAAEGEPSSAAIPALGAAAQHEGAAAMERCDSADAQAGSTAAAGRPAAGTLRQDQEAQQPAAAAQQQPEDAASPAAAGAECQPTAMQTDEGEAAAAAPAQTTAAEPATTTAAGPAATTAAGGIAADVAAGTEQEGRLQAGAEPAATVAANGGGAEAAEREAPPPLWTVRAQYVMAAADAVRKVQQEASAQPEKQALRDVAVDQYEKQLLSEASGWAKGDRSVRMSGAHVLKRMGRGAHMPVSPTWEATLQLGGSALTLLFSGVLQLGRPPDPITCCPAGDPSRGDQRVV